MGIIEDLKWRYATKKFDPSKKLTQEQVDKLIEAANLSASSYGLQAWRIVHVKDQALREELVGASWGQRQVAEASDLFVLCRDEKITEDLIDKYVARVAHTRNQETDDLSGFKGMLMNTTQYDENTAEVWLSKQLYIVLGNLMTVCAVEKIDSLPMEGFDPKKYDEILSLDRFGLKSVVILPVGYRHEDDHYQKLEKVRKNLDELVVTI